MQRYETIIVTKADIEDSVRLSMLEKLKGVIERHKGKVHVLEEMGKFKLAFVFKKQVRGHYTYLGLEGAGSVLTEMDRFLRLNEAVIQFQTVRLEGDFNANLLHPEKMDRMERGRGGDFGGRDYRRDEMDQEFGEPPEMAFAAEAAVEEGSKE